MTIQKIKCAFCDFTDYNLRSHLWEQHQITGDQYEGTIADASFYQSFEAQRVSRKRIPPPSLEEIKVPFGGIDFPVNPYVEKEATLVIPQNYRFPQYGVLAKKACHAILSFMERSHMYIWGLPGSGKDALIHAFCGITRTPAILYQMIPGEDISHWVYARGITPTKGSHWEEGPLLRQIRDGYTGPDGKQHPYVILITDLDRAREEQIEILRLIMDSTEGRIQTHDRVFPVLPGTMIVGTGNTAGSGDPRGRSTSSNPIDASIMDRFETKLEFPWMDWRDERPLLEEKFPDLTEVPKLFDRVGHCTKAIRSAIDTGMETEFSHRLLCAWLKRTQTLLRFSTSNKAKESALLEASTIWLDGMPDPETRSAATHLCDPFLTGSIREIVNPKEEPFDMKNLLK